MKKMLYFIIILLSSTTVYSDNDSHLAPKKATLCVACHGQQGNSTNPLWPNIGGQHNSYIKKQLHDFKQGITRNDPTMAGIVNTLSIHDIEDLSAYYAKQPIARGDVQEKYLARGEQLYRHGDTDKHITSCIACHGPNGTGNAQAGFPMLAGQHALYTIRQLQAFKDNKRNNDLSGVMHTICLAMNKDDMEAVSYYIQSLSNISTVSILSEYVK